MKINVRRPPISSKEQAKAPPDNQINKEPDAKNRLRNAIAGILKIENIFAGAVAGPFPRSY